MKYLILIHSNPKSREIWEDFSDAQRAEGWRDHFALVDELTDCENLDRAIEVAARIPEAAHGLVEVRPVLVSNGLEM